MRKFLKQLEQMKGKTFTYAKQIHCVLDYKINEHHEKVVIKTNLTTFERTYEQVDEFLKYWEPVNNLSIAVDDDPNLNNQLAVFLEQEKSMADKLIGILEDNITKVQASKEYIPQATQINNNINSIINIQKMKMDMVKSIRKTPR